MLKLYEGNITPSAKLWSNLGHFQLDGIGICIPAELFTIHVATQGQDQLSNQLSLSTWQRKDGTARPHISFHTKTESGILVGFLILDWTET